MTVSEEQANVTSDVGGFGRLLRHNRLFVLTLATMIVVVGASLYFGSRQVYEKEAERQHQITLSRVDAAEDVVRILFTNLEQDLSYLTRLEPLKIFISNGFSGRETQGELTTLLEGYLDSHSQFHKLVIFDRFGSAKLAACKANDSTETYGVPLTIPPNQRRLTKGRIWASFAMAPSDNDQVTNKQLAVMTLSCALPSEGSQRSQGYLTLYLDVAALTSFLPKGVFLQTIDGLLLEARKDKPPLVKAADYELVGDSGWLEISDMLTIHYRSFEYLPGERLYAVAYHHHLQLNASLNIMISVALTLLIAFAALSAVIGTITFSRYNNLVHAQQGMMFSLAGLADGRDPETGDHLERTRRYAVHLAMELKKQKEFSPVISSDYLDDLYAAAPLHDIGKVGIPDSILLKPGSLDDDEYEFMKSHVLVAKKVLGQTIKKFKLKDSVFSMGLNIATHHHERFDGKGYPDGLSGEDIPLEARIFALCDAYDAIRSKRPYKGSMSHEEAKQRIVRDSGKHFDPRIVEAFMANEQEFDAISRRIK